MSIGPCVLVAGLGSNKNSLTSLCNKLAVRRLMAGVMDHARSVP